MKLLIILLILIAVGIFKSRTIKKKSQTKGVIETMAEQNCEPDFLTLDDSEYDRTHQRFFAKSKGKDNCSKNSKTKCATSTNDAGHQCYPGKFYSFECTGSGTGCNTKTTRPTCKEVPNCKWTRKSENEDACYSRCTGCFYVSEYFVGSEGKSFSSRYNPTTGKVETSGTKYFIASEANDSASKYLVDVSVCTKASSW